MFSFATAETIGNSPSSPAPKPAPSTPRDLVAVMLRAADKLEARPDLKSAQALLERSGEELTALLNPERRPDWAWFEILFEDDACRLPEALLRAGHILHREDFIACGVETLDWMLRGRALAKCVDAMADACDAAFVATGDLKWLMIGLTAKPPKSNTLARRG